MTPWVKVGKKKKKKIFTIYKKPHNLNKSSVQWNSSFSLKIVGLLISYKDIDDYFNQAHVCSLHLETGQLASELSLSKDRKMGKQQPFHVRQMFLHVLSSFVLLWENIVSQLVSFGGSNRWVNISDIYAKTITQHATRDLFQSPQCGHKYFNSEAQQRRHKMKSKTRRF